MSLDLSIGISGLRAAKIGIDVTGHNIANANTPGYHRQVLRLTERRPISVYGLDLGTGVDVNGIEQVRSNALGTSLLQYGGDQKANESQLQTARQLESLLSTGEGTLHSELNYFFSRLEELSARPHDPTARRDVIRAAEQVSGVFNRVSSDMDQIRNNLRHESEAVVQRVNELSEEIVHLNQQISLAENQGRDPNDLRDQRYAVFSQLSELVDVRVNPASDNISFANGRILLGLTSPRKLEIRETENGWQTFVEGIDQPTEVVSGRLGGILADIETTIPDAKESLDLLANVFMQSFNAQHARGVGPQGALESVTSQLPVVDPTVTLESAINSDGITSGVLPITVINESTGERTLHEIAVDVGTDTLETLATKLSVANVSVSAAGGQLSITADSGYRFDFSGIGNDPDVAPVDESTGLLAALGINVFFLGESASSIRVSPPLTESHEFLATSITGHPGDSDNLTALIAKRWEASSLLNNLTPEEHLSNLTAGVGSHVASLSRTGEGIDLIAANLESQIASISGVDPDEEMVKLIEYQNAFEASARFIAVVNETTDELLRMI